MEELFPRQETDVTVAGVHLPRWRTRTRSPSLSGFWVSLYLSGMAYLRLKHGLRWSILLHAVFNALIIVPITLSIHGKIVIDAHSPQYSLVVTQYAFSEQPEHIRIFKQKTGIDTVHVRQANLQQIVDLIGTPNTWYVDDALVDIDFKATSPIPPDSLISLLGEQFRMIPQTVPNVLLFKPN